MCFSDIFVQTVFHIEQKKKNLVQRIPENRETVCDRITPFWAATEHFQLWQAIDFQKV